MNFHFTAKSRIIFGTGTVHELPGILRQSRIRNLMVIYDQGVKMAGIAEKVMQEIETADVNAVVFDRVLPNPSNELVEEAAVIARQEGVDGFVAVGGGSSIDLAKAVNILLTNPGEIGDFKGREMVKHPVKPLIAIPTTAGTSSEITNVVALIDNQRVCKYVIIDDKIIPEYVIADPEFTRTMPAGVTAATGMDAVTHAVESYISNAATPLTRYQSREGLRILYKNLFRVYMNGNDMKAREQMMLGCIITGFGFLNANLGLVHGIAHTLSAHFGMAHGIANASVLSHVLRYNAETCPEKMIELAEVIGLELTGTACHDKYVLADELERLAKKVGIKRLSEYGIAEGELNMLAKEVLKEDVLIFNPRQNITKDDILQILMEAY